MTDPSAHAVLIRDFANTIDVEDGTDAIATMEGLTTWARDRGLAGDVDERTHTQAIALRAGLRARLLTNNIGAPGTPEAARAIGQAQTVLDALPLRVRLGAASEPGDPLMGEGPLASIGAAWALVVANGEWRRLKMCPDHSCEWVFWDGTRSRTRRWCTMSVCGNRAKARAYAARRRPATD
ncbi:CGNR zinc finger domain-containing protein [Microbispora sp. ZYX-F-249]|uniref:CGNR zinc finger domain-containing protein n=1 Tax=Microbispora maris TaxID=3144104 RepID=A0ABV0AGG6_9ACTN